MALNLSKGDVKVIKKESGQAVTNLTVGVTWGKINKLGSVPAKMGGLRNLFGAVSSAVGALEAVDLDLSIVTVDKNGNFLEDCAFYTPGKAAFGGAIRHSGDDRQGDDEDDGLDNERIQFQGLKVATQTQVQTAYIILNSYTHQKFDQIPYIRLGIYDGLYGLKDKASRLMEFDLTNDKTFVGTESLILAKLNKTSSGWELSAIGKATGDRSIQDIKRRIQTERI